MMENNILFQVLIETFVPYYRCEYPKINVLLRLFDIYTKIIARRKGLMLLGLETEKAYHPSRKRSLVYHLNIKII